MNFSKALHVTAALVLTVFLVAPTAYADEIEAPPPDPYDAPTIGYQSLAAGGTMLVTTTGAMGILMVGTLISASGSSDAVGPALPAVIVASGLALATPAIVAHFVTRVGEARGFPEHRLGAYLGAVIASIGGAAIVLGIGAIDSTSDDSLLFNPYIPAAAWTYLLAPGIGSIAGYHIHASRYQRQTERSSAVNMMPTLQPLVDSTSDQTGLTFGLSGRF